MKPKNLFVVLLGLLVLITGCKASQFSHQIGANLSENPSIPSVSIGELTDLNDSVIGMSLGVFGGAAPDLAISTIDIFVNKGLRYAAVDPGDYYDSAAQVVLFVLSPLAAGDEIKFVIKKNGIPAVTYSGVLSDKKEVMAENVSLVPDTYDAVYAMNAGVWAISDSCTDEQIAKFRTDLTRDNNDYDPFNVSVSIKDGAMTIQDLAGMTPQVGTIDAFGTYIVDLTVDDGIDYKQNSVSGMITQNSLSMSFDAVVAAKENPCVFKTTTIGTIKE